MLGSPKQCRNTALATGTVTASWEPCRSLPQWSRHHYYAHKRVINDRHAAAANGSNRIALRCLRLAVMNALTCSNDLY